MSAEIAHTRGDDWIRFTLTGEIDLDNYERLEGDVVAAISNEVAHATFDMAGVEYIDSAGMRVLFTLAARLELLQIELRLIAPEGSPARRVIELSGLDQLVVLESEGGD